MKHIHLPDLNVRSHTPMSTKSKDLRNSPIKVSTTISSVRNISLSSNRISSGSYKDSKEGTRPVSDETSLTLMDQDSGIKRFGTFLSEIPHKSKHKPTKFVEKLKNYDEVIDGIFKIYNCERSRLHAISLVQLFLGLGYVEEGDTIIEIFKYITEALEKSNKKALEVEYHLDEVNIIKNEIEKVKKQLIRRDEKIRTLHNRNIELEQLLDEQDITSKVLKKMYRACV